MSTAGESQEDIELAKASLLDQDDARMGSKGKETPRGLQKTLIDGACIVLNIASTVFLVFLNKW
jgi:hypothetical protein